MSTKLHLVRCQWKQASHIIILVLLWLGGRHCPVFRMGISVWVSWGQFLKTRVFFHIIYLTVKILIFWGKNTKKGLSAVLNGSEWMESDRKWLGLSTRNGRSDSTRSCLGQLATLKIGKQMTKKFFDIGFLILVKTALDKRDFCCLWWRCMNGSQKDRCREFPRSWTSSNKSGWQEKAIQLKNVSLPFSLRVWRLFWGVWVTLSKKWRIHYQKQGQ